MLLFIFLITDIFLIIAYNNYKKRRNSKSYNTVIGYFIACIIVCVIGIFLIENFGDKIVTDKGLNGGLEYGFKKLVFIIHGIVDLVIFLIFNSKKYTNFKINKSCFFSCLIVTLISLFGIFIELISPIKTYNNELEARKKYTISYLEDRYGDGNFKITNVYKDYSDNGFVSSYLTEYIFEIKSDYLEGNFYIIIDNSRDCITHDTFLFSYYSEKNNLKYSINYHDDDRPFENYDELETYINNLMAISGYSEENNFDIHYYFYDVYHSECINKNGKREIPSLDNFIKNYVENKK